MGALLLSSIYSYVYCFRMTFFLTHGYLEHGKKDWLQEMKDELLKHGDYNVVIVVNIHLEIGSKPSDFLAPDGTMTT